MVTISLCMIVKNEEDVLARCLQSVCDLMDEIIIVDTGSSDRTREIAKEYTEQVYDFTWIDDFSAARNYSFSFATMDYTMWLDADDVLLEEDRQALRRLKQELSPEIDVVMMKYHTAFDEEGKPTFSYYRERLVKTALHLTWQGAVHEVITPTGNIRYEEIAVTHRKLHPSDPDRNLRIFERILRTGGALDARQQFYYARELYYHERYLEAIEAFERFLTSGDGWVENQIEACQQLAYCHYACKDDVQALSALLRSLEYDEPRAEICCMLGAHFLNHGRPRQAVFWYETALSRERKDHSGAFVQPDCYGYLPCIQLCVCYDRLGEHVHAEEYNERAAGYKPNDPSVQHNRAYFAALRDK